jgi:O-antigen/teichoic acid export membrane protein
MKDWRSLYLLLPPAVREMGYYAGGLIGQRLIGLVLLPVNTHYLAPAEFGHLEILLAFIDVGSVLFSVALPTTLSRYVGAAASWEERRVICARIFGVACLVSLALGGICLLYAGTIAQLLPGGASVAEVRLMVATLSLEGLVSTGLTWLRIRGDARGFLVLTLGRSIVYAVLAIILLVSGYGVWGVLVAGAIATILEALLMGYIVLPETGITLRGIEWGSLTIYSGPIVLSGIVGFALGSFDRWVLIDWVGPAELGIYGVAVRVGMFTAALLQPFHMWWMPKRFIVLAEEGGAKRTADTVSIGLVITMLGAVAVTMGGPFLIEFLTAPGFHSATKYVGWLALIYAVQETGSLVEVGCYLRRDGLAPLLFQVVSGGTAIALYFLLIPHYGVAGAIAATLVAQLVRTLLAYLISEVYVHIAFPFARLATFAAVLAAMTAITAATLSPLVLAFVAGPLVLTAGFATAVVLGLVPAFWRAHSSF